MSDAPQCRSKAALNLARSLMLSALTAAVAYAEVPLRIDSPTVALRSRWIEIAEHDPVRVIYEASAPRASANAPLRGSIILDPATGALLQRFAGSVADTQSYVHSEPLIGLDLCFGTCQQDGVMLSIFDLQDRLLERRIRRTHYGPNWFFRSPKPAGAGLFSWEGWLRSFASAAPLNPTPNCEHIARITTLALDLENCRDALLARKVDTGAVRWSIPARASAIALSPAANKVALIEGNGTVQLLDLASGALLASAELPFDANAIYALTWLGDTRLLISRSLVDANTELRAFEVIGQTLEERWQSTAYTGLIAVDQRQRVYVQAANGQRFRLNREGQSPESITIPLRFTLGQIAQLGTTAAVISDSSVIGYDLQTQQELWRFTDNYLPHKPQFQSFMRNSSVWSVIAGSTEAGAPGIALQVRDALGELVYSELPPDLAGLQTHLSWAAAGNNTALHLREVNQSVLQMRNSTGQLLWAITSNSTQSSARLYASNSYVQLGNALYAASSGALLRVLPDNSQLLSDRIVVTQAPGSAGTLSDTAIGSVLRTFTGAFGFDAPRQEILLAGNVEQGAELITLDAKGNEQARVTIDARLRSRDPILVADARLLVPTGQVYSTRNGALLLSADGFFRPLPNPLWTYEDGRWVMPQALRNPHMPADQLLFELDASKQFAGYRWLGSTQWPGSGTRYVGQSRARYWLDEHGIQLHAPMKPVREAIEPVAHTLKLISIGSHSEGGQAVEFAIERTGPIGDSIWNISGGDERMLIKFLGCSGCDAAAFTSLPSRIRFDATHTEVRLRYRLRFFGDISESFAAQSIRASVFCDREFLEANIFDNVLIVQPHVGDFANGFEGPVD
jgi:hypothetical protein